MTLGSTNYTISGIYLGDQVDISNIYTSNFNDINVGTNKIMYINNINLIGNSYFNYTISISGVSTGSITQAPLIPTFIVNKTYDKTQSTVINYTLSGIYNIDLGLITLSSSLYGLYRNNQLAINNGGITSEYSDFAFSQLLILNQYYKYQIKYNLILLIEFYHTFYLL